MTTLVRAETLKVLTLRYWWALAIAPVVVAVLIAASTRTFVEVVADSADTTFDVDVVSTGVSLGVSNTLVLVFAAVFGALTAGSEFGYKTLTTTFLTARGRDGVLGAKLAVVAVFAVGYALAVEVVSIGAMLLFGRDFSFTTDLFAICAAGILACALWALLGAGVALLTGSSMAGALSVIVAVPVAPPDTCAMITQEADACVCLETHAPFYAVGVWYDEFPQLTDEEVRAALGAHTLFGTTQGTAAATSGPS